MEVWIKLLHYCNVYRANDLVVSLFFFLNSSFALLFRKKEERGVVMPGIIWLFHLLDLLHVYTTALLIRDACHHQSIKLIRYQGAVGEYKTGPPNIVRHRKHTTLHPSEYREVQLLGCKIDQDHWRRWQCALENQYNVYISGFYVRARAWIYKEVIRNPTQVWFVNPCVLLASVTTNARSLLFIFLCILHFHSPEYESQKPIDGGNPVDPASLGSSLRFT